MTIASSRARTVDERHSFANADSRSVARVFDTGAAVWTVALLLCVGVGLRGPAVLVLALVFVTFVPGWAVVPEPAAPDVTTRAALAVAVSLTSCGAGALAMVWLDQWHPGLLLKVAAGLSLGALIVRHARSGEVGGHR